MYARCSDTCVFGCWEPFEACNVCAEMFKTSLGRGRVRAHELHCRFGWSYFAFRRANGWHIAGRSELAVRRMFSKLHTFNASAAAG